MKIPLFVRLLGAIAIISTANLSADSSTPVSAQADPTHAISAASILARTKILASDDFEGRAPGSAGEEKTVAYLISEFKK